VYEKLPFGLFAAHFSIGIRTGDGGGEIPEDQYRSAGATIH
jgi:hypothetical protein